MAKKKQDWTPRGEFRRTQRLHKAYDLLEQIAIEEGLLEEDEELMYQVTEHFGRIVQLMGIDPDKFWNDA